MICYTLSDCVLKNISTDANKKEIVNDLLNVFPQKNNPHKVVVDRHDKIIEIYESLIDDDNPAIFYWLQNMGDFPKSWEPIDVNNIEQATTNEDIFLMVCSQTKDKLLIAYSHNGWTREQYYHKRNILFGNTPIRVLDRDDSIKLLALSQNDAESEISTYNSDLQQPTIVQNNIKNSIVAQGNSSINNAKIEEK